MVEYQNNFAAGGAEYQIWFLIYLLVYLFFVMSVPPKQSINFSSNICESYFKIWSQTVGIASNIKAYSLGVTEKLKF